MHFVENYPKNLFDICRFKIHPNLLFHDIFKKRVMNEAALERFVLSSLRK